MKNSYNRISLKPLKKKTKRKQNFPTFLDLDDNNKSTKSLMTPDTRLKDIETSSSRKKIENFQELISNCDDLIKDVSCLSINIKHNLTQRKRGKAKTQKKVEPEIRNTFYFEGLRRIEEKIQSITDKGKQCELKNLKTLVDSSSSCCIENFITAEDLNSQAGIEFLAENKREFGSKLLGAQVSPAKESYKYKNKKIFNKKSSLFEYLNEESERIKKHRYSVPSLSKPKVESPKLCNHKLPVLETKRKLPLLDMATIQTQRARAEANYFFADNKMIKTRANKRRETMPGNF